MLYTNSYICDDNTTHDFQRFSLSVLTAIFQVYLGWPVFIEAKDDGSGGENWSYKSCKATVKSSPLTNQHPAFLQAGSPSCRPKQCQSTEGKNITFHGLAYPKLTWGLPTLSLTTNSSWLLWGRVAMPLISPDIRQRKFVKVNHSQKQ